MAEDDSRPGGVDDAASAQPAEGAGWQQNQPRSGGSLDPVSADPWATSPQQDYRYFGPYDPPDHVQADPVQADPVQADQGRPDPLGVGSWAEDERTQPLPPAGPSFAAHPSSGYPGPGTVPPQSRAVPQLAPGYPPPGAPHRPPNPARQVRAGTVIAIATVTALLIGGSAGYAGSRLAERSAGAAAPSASAPASQQTAPVPSANVRSVAPAPDAMNAVAVAAAALPSTVMIRVGSSPDGSIGSGFVLDDSGLIMTNNHVVAAAASGARLRVVFSDGAIATASLVGRSPTYDIAVIRVKTSHSLVPMPIGNSDDTRVGESVLAVGSPLGLPGTVTQGIVSARNRPVAVGTEGQSSNAYINGTQTDAPINPGNSGGPLLDAGGRVIGVNSAILTLGSDRQQAGNIGLGFAIPINQAMEIGTMLITDGRATYPVIGAEVTDSGDLAGVRLVSVDQSGPADRAGLRADDVVTKIGQERVRAADELIVAIRSHRPGEQVTLTYRRNGATSEVRVTLGSREG
jgi:putative serine protease PepD